MLVLERLLCRVVVVREFHRDLQKAAMASGIAISSKCLEKYAALSKREFSIMVLKINDTMTEVDVEKTIDASHDPEPEWKDFIKTLPENDCRFIVADFQVKETATVTKAKICMILWSPEYAPIKSKMIYASSREAVVNKAPVVRSIQATEIDELSYGVLKDTVFK